MSGTAKCIKSTQELSRTAGRLVHTSVLAQSPSDLGSGAGRGGGAGGTIRESGGGLGRMGAAHEEGYFYNKEKELLEELKKKNKLKKNLDEKLGSGKPEQKS